MAIEIVELHHPGYRIDETLLDTTVEFYTNVLGLERDKSRPTIPGIPGAWINVGEVGQLHLIGGKQPSPVAKGPGEDPTRPHVAFAVADILAAKKELDRMGVTYWRIEGLTSPDALQVFMNDPCGNMLELHQIDKCNCRASNRAKA
ncbi:MAG: VOC family protein [Reyranella sp.]|uniref:VOC family protein n=1 Tax=Reyranella sp. TaxID=1929291 RepID=UPI0027312DC6|nr:VOC family protein [Reyranella sp.]MDP1962538.1 VOC family protein [Reyranella sp.]MDP2373382.1 VOC family protein [Reyranella sp.]